jgi:2-dehydro-3-deoxygluconokinase
MCWRSTAVGWRGNLKHMSVTCFGEILLRLSPPDRHLLVQAAGFGLAIGGAEANVGSALASLGHPVRFAGVVSDNPLGDRALAALRSGGIDTGFIARVPGRMGLYFLEAGSGLRPSAITYDRAGSAFACAVPEAIDFAGALAGVQLLHCGGSLQRLARTGWRWPRRRRRPRARRAYRSASTAIFARNCGMRGTAIRRRSYANWWQRRRS